MKKLEKYYKNGYDFTLIHREGDLAISLGKSRMHDGENWEVFEVQSHNGMMMGENWVDAAEFPAGNNQWGDKGWTAINEADAWRIFNKQKQNALQ
jgi:hypothetical protein